MELSGLGRFCLKIDKKSFKLYSEKQLEDIEILLIL